MGLITLNKFDLLLSTWFTNSEKKRWEKSVIYGSWFWSNNEDNLYSYHISEIVSIFRLLAVYLTALLRITECLIDTPTHISSNVRINWTTLIHNSSLRYAESTLRGFNLCIFKTLTNRSLYSIWFACNFILTYSTETRVQNIQLRDLQLRHLYNIPPHIKYSTGMRRKIFQLFSV